MSGNIPDNIDLKGARLRAMLTQADLAKRLGVAQSQILRYETEPENVTVRVAREWMTACGSMNPGNGPDYGKPYLWIPQRLANLASLVRKQPPLLKGDTSLPAIGSEDIISVVEQIGRKPRIVLCGRFDAGKSRLANTLLGGNSLPAAYQPTTRIVCLIRHISDKPSWQTEDVWIMDDTFQLSESQNETECERSKIISGGLETIQRYGAHGPDRLPRDPGFALVYLDSPILHTCDIVDTPGLAHNDNDNALASSAKAYGDAVIYLSPIANFMNGEDIAAISTLIEALPAQTNAHPLRGLTVLATHAHPGITDVDIVSALDRGAERLFEILSPLFYQDEKFQCEEITPFALRARFFPWYVEITERRSPFEIDLQKLLKSILPDAIRARLNKAIVQLQENAGDQLSREIREAEALLTQQAEMADLLDELLAVEDDRKESIKQKTELVRTFINQARTETAEFIKKEISPLISEDAIRKLITENFDDSKKAEENAGNLLLTGLRTRVERFIAAKSDELSALVEQLLGEFALDFGDGLGDVFVPFDAQAAFLGGLAAGGVFGALAIWAAVVAEGSNLGAYLLVPQIVSLLARLGIGIAGGTATGISIVSALGGPVGIGVGIALSAGLLIWQLFGRSWQTRLAKGLAEVISKKNLQGIIRGSCEQFWDDTRKGFDTAIAVTGQKHEEYLERLKDQVKKQTPRQTQARLDRIKARAAFMSFIPWQDEET